MAPSTGEPKKVIGYYTEEGKTVLVYGFDNRITIAGDVRLLLVNGLGELEWFTKPEANYIAKIATDFYEKRKNTRGSQY